MGHPNNNVLKIAAEKTDGIDLNTVDCSDRSVCDVCVRGKMAMGKFVSSQTRTSELLELVHSDVSGPFAVPSISGNRYALTFVDDFSRKVFLYLLKSKDQVFEKFCQFKAFAENQTGKKIKSFRSDNGGEYVNKRLEDFLKDSGIKHQTSIAYVKQQNGTAERMNRTLQDKARCLLLNSELPLKFWGEAMNTAAYVRNRLPSRSIDDQIPEEVWSGRKVNLSNLRIFGCLAYAHVPKEKRDSKWDERAVACIFVGYSETQKAYRLLELNNPKNVIFARDVVFAELEKCANKRGNLSNSVSDCVVENPSEF